MDSAASRQLLKVLSGPQAGGELLLADGDYVIGSDDASEIVLLDDYVAPRHARLSVRGAAIACQPLDGAQIVLDGAGSDGGQLAPFQCFTLGATHLAVGPAEAKWPPISLPNGPQAPPPVPPAVTGDEKARPTEEAEAQDAPAESRSAAATVAAVASPPAAPARAGRAKNRGVWAAALGLLTLAVVIFGGLLWLALSDPPVAPVISREVQQAALQAAIDKLGFGESVSVSDQHGRFVVTGHVPTPADKRAVREAVVGLDPATRLRVYDAETLLATVTDLLRMNRLEFTARSGRPGEVIVSGLLRDATQWSRVKQRILTDMPQLAALTEEFANVPRVTVETAAAEPETGPVAEPPDESTAPPPVVAAVDPAPAIEPEPLGMTAIPSLPPIQGINAGNTRFITLANGERVFRGAVLESGYTVREIEADRVVLARGASVHVIKIGS